MLRGDNMPDYKKMYMILCKAADDAITALESEPVALTVAASLQAALYAAEDVYIETADDD